MAIPSIPTSMAPWLSVTDGPAAVAFYKAAFNATETYRLEMPDGGLVVKLSVEGAEFWISGDPSQANESGSLPLAQKAVRMILTVADPETVFIKALEAGATEVYPVSIGHGWKIGRLTDPFGLDWEIGHLV